MNEPLIKLENVNKYFNRHKKNEIHVINNNTLTFPTSGLVAILGPSGCGKTTLLNVMGGLDKVESGHIYIDNERITKRGSHKIDEIRNLKIGYIFQDYKLIDNMSVFDNVALSLKINGIKDKEEIKKRVLYTLDKVGMLRYKNRPAGMLSGGERQRVGIARALVKNPKIIIADEPTGNLDSRVSLEIMNIIKSISNKYLVILVTHEEELANFYATKIVKLQDGIVTDIYDNNNNGSLNYQIENRIYLQDFKQIDKLEKDNLNINVYRDNNEDLNINIVFKNGNIYIETKDKNKLEVVENNSNIELIDEHFKEIKDNNINTNNFDIESISNLKDKEKYSSIFHLASYIPKGFKKLLDYPILKKILLIGFFLSGMFIFYATSSIFATLHIDDKDFITMNKNYLTASVKNMQVDDYVEYENNQDILYMLPSNSLVKFKVNYEKYLQTMYAYNTISASLSSIDEVNSNILIKGRMPKNNYEVVIDKMVLDKFIESNTSIMAGYNNIDDMLDKDICLNNLDNFKIVGITNIEEPNIYTNKEMFINIIANSYKEEDYDIRENTYLDYELVKNKIKIVEGRSPVNDYEVIINNLDRYEGELNKEINNKINNHKLKVVGYYENINDDIDNYLVNNNMIKYDLINNTSNLSIYPKDNSSDQVLSYFRNMKIKIDNSYTYAKDNYLKENHDTMVSALILAGVILAISLIEILLMIRSSFLSRIKEVGIYRAIGIKKSDIYKMFSGEIIAITIVASLTGILFMSYILYCLKNVPLIGDLYMVNIFTVIFSFIVVLLFNLIVGLLPVYNTIRKTPAVILAREDVD